METLNIKNDQYLLLGLLVLLATATAIIPNISHQFYESGMSFPVIDQLNTRSYLVFAIALVGAWEILRDSKVKWLLLSLIPVAYFKPLLWAVASIAWSTGAFAPY